MFDIVSIVFLNNEELDQKGILGQAPSFCPLMRYFVLNQGAR